MIASLDIFVKCIARSLISFRIVPIMKSMLSLSYDSTTNLIFQFMWGLQHEKLMEAAEELEHAFKMLQNFSDTRSV